MGNDYTNLDFFLHFYYVFTFFCFRLMSPYGQTDGRTDGQMGKMCNVAYSMAL